MNNIPYRWQWPRFLHGDALEVLADFGAKAAVYDIEFLGESTPGINMNEVGNIKQKLQNNFARIYEDYKKSTTILANDPSAASRLKSTHDNFNAKIFEYYSNINSDIDKLLMDNDIYLAKRARYFGKAYGTVNMLFDKELSEADIYKKAEDENLVNLERYGTNSLLLLKNKKHHPAIKKVNISEFTTEKILAELKGVGFTKVERDKDASIRFIDLFFEKKGFVIPQLALKPFFDIYEIKPAMIDLSANDKIILKKVKFNNKEKNISIPLDHGRMRINWPKGEFSDIFVNKKTKIEGKYYHFSYLGLLKYKQISEDFTSLVFDTLTNINDSEAPAIYKEYKNYLDAKNNLLENSILTDELRTEVNKTYDAILEKIINYSSFENSSLKTKEIDNLISSPNTPINQKTELEEIKKNFTEALLKLNSDAKSLAENRIILKNILENKICFIGLTATGTSDLGSTPFDKKFSNVGTHPSVYNTILQNDFIHITPLWLIILLSLILTAAGILILIKKDAVYIQTTAGFSLFGFFIFDFIFYHFTNIYFSPVIPVLSMSISFIILTLFKFILTEKDKSFIKNAFGRYLSPDVIKELLKDPSKLVLGGERKNCTAVFTDIESFSSISEKFKDDAPGLVSLLNNYLSAMSDIILENQGTIDKYEGDAIIAFFGAPYNMPDHAYKACYSAIKMKKIEEELNKNLLKKEIIDKPLHTRIGINTGDMFVGNMGTAQKFNYTMMGHHVNLASRIEGVNKLYGTYAMASEYTYELIKDKIVCRKLDRVRVVNINAPIGLYELISLKDELDNELKNKLENFEKAMDLFGKQEWQEALKYFKKSRYNEQWDKAVLLYIERCEKFIKNPPEKSWDGVYNMSVK